MTIVHNYIAGDARAGAIIMEIGAVIGLVSSVGAFIGLTGHSSGGLRSFGAVKTALLGLTVLRLGNWLRKAEATDGSNPKATLLKAGDFSIKALKLGAGALESIECAKPYARICRRVVTTFGPALTAGKLAWKDLRGFTQIRLALTLALMALGSTWLDPTFAGFAKTAGILTSAAALYDARLWLHEIEDK